ncbi:hypothetical protein KFK09_024274 [Dendrobium nobile]|uniref:Uncharacterized protein n=1 Tax=Dendrobium nobile TaxID=94219 RepID=A0A8T3ADL5_DENNO|nr:hypothetical protein KFK09_024274 [Dendrobium nobile]
MASKVLRLLFIALICVSILYLLSFHLFIHLPAEISSHRLKAGWNDSVETRWAILVAGSKGYSNYRHQADICHAYQIMKNGGLKDENIIVFMYDDIAYHKKNPRPGIIINRPDGGDVYAGVPKDYIGDDVNVNNFFAVLLGDKKSLSGGSGKVVDSGPDDHIFIFYTDHGNTGFLAMPTNSVIKAKDFITVLKKKHASNSYKKMVIYLQACHSGSIFKNLLPEDMNIYATTSSNDMENSFPTYCPGYNPSPPLEYSTCLGTLYSVSWMEYSDSHNLRTKTLRELYELVKTRTSVHGTYLHGSHVMEFGDLNIGEEKVFKFIGSNPVNDNS